MNFFWIKRKGDEKEEEKKKYQTTNECVVFNLLSAGRKQKTILDYVI